MGTYTRRIGLRHFDGVVIISATRFTKIDIELREELKYHGVPFFTLRQKIDSDIRSNLVVNGLGAEVTLQTITNELRAKGIENPYLVDSFSPQNHDFPKLVRDIHASIVAHRTHTENNV